MSRVTACRTIMAVALVLGLWPAWSSAQNAPAQNRPVEPPTQADPHRDHAREQEQPPPPAGPAADHEDHAAHQPPSPQALPPSIPPVTDADRATAFPDVAGHAAHDDAVHAFVLLDQLEWQATEGRGSADWDSRGWIGRDLDRFWFRTEGAGRDGRVDDAHAHVLYGRAIARWWDVVLGVRQDVGVGPNRTWAAIGVQGLAPYWFEVEATAYVGASGRSHFRVETEYELLLTNRLVLQPLAEIEIHGKSDPERGIGAGLSTIEAGLRLRYEIRREVAPYVGLAWGRKYFGTADLAKTAGARSEGARLALGIRLWY